jgi:acetylornithine deacetylase/succinyl-diaminopimelate desuccinylase-like protein
MYETGGNPAVFGERRVRGATRTLLRYCHYDTRPVPPGGWLQPSPLEPVFRSGLPEADVTVAPLDRIADGALPAHRVDARGAADDKGPIQCHLSALGLLDRLSLAPRVNVKLILDGEEEVGSPCVGAFAERHRELLAADLAIMTAGPTHETGRPTVAGGARGIMKLELVLARRDLHSGNFAIPDPAWKLVALLASMATPDGAPLIEGLQADAGPGAGPGHAHAGPPPRGAHIPPDPHHPGPPERLRGYDPAKTSLELPVAREVVAAVERALGESVPLFAFTDVLRLPTLVVPYANAGNRQPSPNEHLRLDHLFQGIRTTTPPLRDLA